MPDPGPAAGPALDPRPDPLDLGSDDLKDGWTDQLAATDDGGSDSRRPVGASQDHRDGRHLHALQQHFANYPTTPIPLRAGP